MNTSPQLAGLENLLKDNNIDYEIIHDSLNLKTAVHGAGHYGISLSEAAPTLILKTKDKYIAAIIPGDTRVSFKKLKKALNAKDLTMADPKTILDITGAKIGEVSLINPKLTTVIDERVLTNNYCYGGTGIAQKTLKISTKDLANITQADIIDFAEKRS